MLYTAFRLLSAGLEFTFEILSDLLLPPARCPCLEYDLHQIGYGGLYLQTCKRCGKTTEVRR